MSGLKVTCFDCGQVNRVPADKLDAAPKCASCGAHLITEKAVEIDMRTLEKAARNDDLPLVVDFWAPWCGPCKMMAPAFEQAAAELEPNVRLAKLNTEVEQSTAAHFNIRSIPTLVLFKNGREVARQPGAMGAADIVRWVKANN